MTDHFALDRRALMARILFIVGATTFTGIGPDAFAKSTRRSRRYFATPAFKLLEAVADTIIPRTETPGAVDAGVTKLVDAMLRNWASESRRTEITQALLQIDNKAKQIHSISFISLELITRHQLLAAHDIEALKVKPGKPARGTPSLTSGPSHSDPGYAKLKELIVLLYYMSEPALTQELSYVHSPGEWIPSIPVTTETRPAAGTMF